MTETAPTKAEIDEKSRTLADKILYYLIETSSIGPIDNPNADPEPSEEQTGGDNE